MGTEKQELVNQKSSLSCREGNKLSKDQAVIFCNAVTKMSLAKNIKLAAGTIGAWEECVLEDLQKDRFTFYEFILATKKVIREPVFNRIDYADIYQLAKSIADDRKRLTPTKIDLSGGDTMPQNIKDMISPIGKRI